MNLNFGHLFANAIDGGESPLGQIRSEDSLSGFRDLISDMIFRSRSADLSSQELPLRGKIQSPGEIDAVPLESVLLSLEQTSPSVAPASPDIEPPLEGGESLPVLGSRPVDVGPVEEKEKVAEIWPLESLVETGPGTHKELAESKSEARGIENSTEASLPRIFGEKDSSAKSGDEPTPFRLGRPPQTHKAARKEELVGPQIEGLKTDLALVSNEKIAQERFVPVRSEVRTEPGDRQGEMMESRAPRPTAELVEGSVEPSVEPTRRAQESVPQPEFSEPTLSSRPTVAPVLGSRLVESYPEIEQANRDTPSHTAVPAIEPKMASEIPQHDSITMMGKPVASAGPRQPDVLEDGGEELTRADSPVEQTVFKAEITGERSALLDNSLVKAGPQKPTLSLPSREPSLADNPELSKREQRSAPQLKFGLATEGERAAPAAPQQTNSPQVEMNSRQVDKNSRHVEMSSSEVVRPGRDALPQTPEVSQTQPKPKTEIQRAGFGEGDKSPRQSEDSEIRSLPESTAKLRPRANSESKENGANETVRGRTTQPKAPGQETQKQGIVKDPVSSEEPGSLYVQEPTQVMGLENEQVRPQPQKPGQPILTLVAPRVLPSRPLQLQNWQVLSSPKGQNVEGGLDRLALHNALQHPQLSLPLASLDAASPAPQRTRVQLPEASLPQATQALAGEAMPALPTDLPVARIKEFGLVQDEKQARLWVFQEDSKTVRVSQRSASESMPKPTSGQESIPRNEVSSFARNLVQGVSAEVDTTLSTAGSLPPTRVGVPVPVPSLAPKQQERASLSLGSELVASEAPSPEMKVSARLATDSLSSPPPKEQSVGSKVSVTQLSEVILKNLSKSEAARGHRLEIELSPERLGKLTVELSLSPDGKKVDSLMLVSSEAAREVLEQQMPQLKAKLSDLGLDLESRLLSTSENHSGADNERGGREQSHVPRGSLNEEPQLGTDEPESPSEGQELYA